MILALSAAHGRITGTVKHTPAVLVRRLVILIDDLTCQVIQQTWSDDLTGIYAFNNLGMGRTYTVLSYDPTNTFLPVAVTGVTPELMP